MGRRVSYDATGHGEPPQKRYSLVGARGAVQTALVTSGIAVMAIAVFLLFTWGGSPDKGGGFVYAAWVLIGGALIAVAGLVADFMSHATEAQIQDLELSSANAEEPIADLVGENGQEYPGNRRRRR